MLRISACAVVLFFLAITMQAQHLTLLEVDSTHFPQMRAKIYLLADNEGARELPILQVELRDNGIQCASKQSPTPYSDGERARNVYVTMDISQSSEESASIRALSHLAVQTLAQSITSGGIEVGLGFFDNNAHIASDFQSPATRVLSSLSKAFVGRATSYTRALMQEKTGAFQMFPENSSHNVVVLICDGSDSLDVERASSMARSHNCTVFALCVGSFASTQLVALTESTGGHCFSNLTDSMEVRDAAATVGGIISGAQCLNVEWTTSDIASARHNVMLGIPTANRWLTFDYSVHDQKRAILEHPSHLSFGTIIPGKPGSAMLAFHAVNFDITIDSVEFRGMPFYSTSVKYPLTIKAFTTYDMPITYSPKDSGYTWTRMFIYSKQFGSESITMSGGFHDRPASGRSLQILRPLQGEQLPVDSYYPIEWEGCAPEDFSRVELSTDGGHTYRIIQENVRGNLYMMKTPKETHEECRIRVTQKAATNTGERAIQVDSTIGLFALVNPATFCSEVRMNPTVVGERKDKTFTEFIRNTTKKRIRVESVELLGDHASEFRLCSQLPPYSLEPGETHALEIAFSPTMVGSRYARVNFKTSAGYASARVAAYGLAKGVEMNPSIVDFGVVQTGDSLTIDANAVLYNNGQTHLTITKAFLIGPDTTQFRLNTQVPKDRVQRGQKFPLSFTFVPTSEGRTSSEAVFTSDGEDSPHIIQLVAAGATHMKDPTMFREVVSPTAQTLKAGTFAVGDFDVLGVLGAFGVTDHLMIQVGGVIPFPVNHQTTLVYSAGLKFGYPIASNVSIAAGYQYARSRYDLSTTDVTESNVYMHVPYIVGTYGNDDARVSAAFGYAFKHHVTSLEPNGFDADAALATLSGDVRIAGRWKICAESYYFRTLGSLPIVATARYIGNSYTLDLGLSYIGLKTDSSPAPKLPVLPVLGIMWTF